MTAKMGLPDFKNGRFKAALFDLDGTLVDSMWVWERLMIDFVEKYKLETPQYIYDEVAHMSLAQSSVYVRQELGLSMTPDEIYAEWSGTLKDAYANKIKAKSGAEAYIKRLSEYGIRIGLATACDPVLGELCLKNNNLYGLFDTMVYVDDVGKGKNFPDIFLRCLDNLSCKPEETVLFDDIIVSIKTAKSMGMATVAVEESKDAAVKEQLIKEADYYITDFEI